jgi:formylglycine-generating enzyme
MKKGFNYLWLLVLSITIASCGHGGYNGQLLGVLDRPDWTVEIPYGTVYIHSGTLHVGPSDQDVNTALVQRPRSISVQGFFMDNTEITNNEYRQFVMWVRDSIAHKLMGGEYLLAEGEPNERINWEKDVDWSSEDAKEKLEEMYYAETERFWGQKQIDPTKLNYNLIWIDYKDAARKENRGKPRNSFLKNEIINIYPDTMCWVHDFTYSYNEPMTRNYFNHPSFDNYPVVGINWRQATAFCIWRTRFKNDFNRMNAKFDDEDFRLPTEAEWEYGARGGHDNSPYPWGGPYLRNARGCILANFKPMRGNYPEDGGLYTVKADAYFPNDFGLYNMAGNVAEWCSDAYFENAYSFNHDLNPSMMYNSKDDDADAMKRKVIRGGSWKDIGYYLQCGTRHWEFQDTAKCYVGFRCVQTFMGRSLADFQK